LRIGLFGHDEFDSFTLGHWPALGNPAFREFMRFPGGAESLLSGGGR
jgi:hypothetical protein